MKMKLKFGAMWWDVKIKSSEHPQVKWVTRMSYPHLGGWAIVKARKPITILNTRDLGGEACLMSFINLERFVKLYQVNNGCIYVVAILGEWRRILKFDARIWRVHLNTWTWHFGDKSKEWKMKKRRKFGINLWNIYNRIVVYTFIFLKDCKRWHILSY